jgi:tetratricopeptide (TPR) repeat protein
MRPAVAAAVLALGLFLRLGDLLYKEGFRKDAQAEWTKTLELDPSFTPAYVSMGLAEYDEGRNASAKAMFQKALDLNADSAEALEAVKRYDEAIEAYDNFIRYTPYFLAHLPN